MPLKRRQAGGLHRVLGTAALFSTAYGNVGSSIYYALGLVTVYALGLTPIVFFISGAIFFFTAVTYAEATARFPEAGGSSSFTRHAFNEAVSFFAGWAQMLNYTATIAISAIFVPHYLNKFDPSLNLIGHPNDIIGGAIVVALLMLVARPVTVFLCCLPDRRARWSLNEMLFMCWTRETGVIPAALAGLLVGLKAPGAQTIMSVTFIAILMTILIQAPTTKWLGKSLGLLQEAKRPARRN